MENKIEIKNENIKKFLEKISQEPELQAKISQIRDPEEAYKLASSLQEGFTKEEFVTEMKRLYEEITRDLSDEDMAKVAGGENAGFVASMVTVSVGFGATWSVAITGSAAAAICYDSRDEFSSISPGP